MLLFGLVLDASQFRRERILLLLGGGGRRLLVAQLRDGRVAARLQQALLEKEPAVCVRVRVREGRVQ